jgi:hypothetical protein
MSKNFTQFSLIHRDYVEAFTKVGIMQKIIESEIRFHPSTISRELSINIAQRGKTSGAYLAANA